MKSDVPMVTEAIAVFCVCDCVCGNEEGGKGVMGDG